MAGDVKAKDQDTVKIEEWTPEQEAKLPEYKEKWLAIGQNCGELDMEKAIPAVIKAYQGANVEPPELFLHMPSPKTAAFCGAFLETLFSEDENLRETQAKLWRIVIERRLNRKRVTPTIGYAVFHTIEQLHEKLGEDRLRAEAQAVLEDDPENIVDEDDMASFMWQPTASQLESQLRAQSFGAHDAAWLGFYDFFLNEVKLDCVKPLEGLIELAKHCGWWTPLRGIAILQDRPLEQHIVNGMLHRDGGPALAYRDGWSLYVLNDTRVPKELACKPADKIDPQLLVKMPNVQVRAQFVSKVGIERILDAFKAEVIDTDTLHGQKYELLSLKLPDRNDEARPYLRMWNPSENDQDGKPLVHIEGVAPEITTVKQALAWRARLPVQPAQIT